MYVMAVAPSPTLKWLKSRPSFVSASTIQTPFSSDPVVLIT